jgi:tellurite resistance protein TehA-like permease
MKNFIKRKAANLFSGYFSMVMATGALSIATHLLGMSMVAWVLVVFNVIVFIGLWFFTLIRVIKFFPRVMDDVASHTQGPGFFTSVAGTCVLGSQLIIVANQYVLASFLWGLGILLWMIVMYTFFTAVTVRKNKPELGEGINGAWLIAAVATQSISILGILLSSHVGEGREVILFFTLCMFLLGCMLYLNIITLIFYRFMFVELKFAALTPPYWINMGAVAITTLAGSTLMLHTENWSFLVEVTPFLKGFTLFFWVAGTWWIPLLFILMIWKHIYHRFPLKYDPQYWGMAFPLAMYTTSTYQLSRAIELPFLQVIPRLMVFVALAAWIIVLLGFVYHTYQSAREIGFGKGEFN